MTRDDLAQLLPRPRDEAWKYTAPRRLFAAVADDALAALPATATAAAPDADRDAWGLAPLLDRLAPEAVPAAPTDATHAAAPGLSGARRVFRAPAGDHVLVQRFTGAGAHLCEDAIEVPAGASLLHVRVVAPEADATHAGLVAVKVDGGGAYTLVSVLAGGAVARVDVAVRLRGPGARAALRGLTVVGGERHADHHLTVHHDAPGCASSQDFRALVDGEGRSVFTGRVVIRRGADGAEAAQLHRALLLSDRAVATARPQLEIHTDDVKASHGTAVGGLDPDALFYLRQRGLDPAEARELLVGAFASAVFDALPEPLRDALHAELPRWRA